MIARHTVIRVQTLTKSEYNRSKHLPNANPSHGISQETGEPAILIDPTPLPTIIDSPLRSQSQTERKVRSMLPDTEEKSEIQRRTQRSARGFGSPGPLDNESYIAKEFQVLNEELEEARQEINQLREEREYIIKDFEERLKYMRGGEVDNSSYTRRIRELENENHNLKDELSRSIRQSVGSDTYDSRSKREYEDLKIQINNAIKERDYFESQNKQIKMIQVNLEQEIRQKVDERNKMFSDYEIRIAGLQNEITLLRSQNQGDNLRQSQTLNRIQDENISMSSELIKLRQQKSDLETQIESLLRDKMSGDSTIRIRLAEIEAANTSNIHLLEQERRTNQALRANLQERERELISRETEINELRIKSEGTEGYDHLHVLLMAEIERLHNLIAMRINEYEILQLEHEQELKEAQSMNESSLKNSLREEILLVHNQLREEREQTEIELAGLRKIIIEYEAKIASLTSDLERANRKTLERSYELESFRPNQPQNVYIEDYGKKSEAEIEKKAGYVTEAEENVKFAAERSKLENVIRNLKVKIMEDENEHVLLMIEIERLGNLVSELQDESEGWKAKAIQSSGVENTYNIQTEVITQSPERSAVIKRLEVENHDLELQIQGYKVKTQDLENKVRFLQEENEQLQQTNLDRIRELDEWKFKFTQIEGRMDQITETISSEIRMKQQTELIEASERWSKERTYLDDQISQSRNKLRELENQILLLTSEKTHLNQTISSRDSEIEAARRKIIENEENYNRMIESLKEQYEISFNQRIEIELMNRSNQIGSEKLLLESDLRNANAKVVSLEEQLTNHRNDLMKLRQEVFEKSTKIEELNHKLSILNERDAEVQAWKSRYEEAQKLHAKDIEGLTNRLNNSIREDLGREIRETQHRWESDKLILEDNLRMAIDQKEILEEQLVILRGEINRMQAIIESLREENNDWRIKVQSQEQDMIAMKFEIDTRVRQTLEKELGDVNLKFTGERDQLENQMISLRLLNDELKSKDVLIMIELERLTQILKDRDDEIQVLHQKINEIENSHESYVIKIRQEQENLLRSRVENELKEQGNKLEPEKKALEGEVGSLTKRNIELENELAMIREENFRIREDLAALNSQLEQQETRFSQLQWEHETYINELKSELNIQLTSEFEGKMKQLTEKFMEERKNLDNTVRKLKSRTVELEGHLEESEERNSRLLDEVYQKTEETENAKRKYNELEKHSLNSLKDLTEKLEIEKKQEIEEVVKRSGNQFKEELRGVENNLNRAQERTENLQNRISTLIAENDKLMQTQSETLRELEEVKEAFNRANSQFITEKSTIEHRYSLLNERVEDYEKRISGLNTEILNLQRLNADKTREIEELKVHSQGSSSQWSVEKTIIENQNNLLSEKIKDYEKRLTGLTEELNNLNRLNITRASEIEELRAASRSANSQWMLDKSVLEGRINAFIEKIQNLEMRIVLTNAEIERLTILNVNIRSELEEQIRMVDRYERDARITLDQLRNQLETKNKQEKEELELRLKQIFDQKRTEYENQLHNAQRNIGEYERKIIALTAELESLGFQNRAKTDEINQWREKTLLIENIKNQEIERLRQEFEHEKREIGEKLINDRIETERAQASAKIRELKSKINDLETRNTYITVELERQSSLFKQKSKEVESWREKYNKLENSKFVEIDEVKNQVELLKHSSLQINDYEVRFRAERSAYEAQILQYKQKFEELETKIEDLTIENERMNSLYREKRREAEEFKARPASVDMRNSHVELESYRREIEALKRDKFDYNAAKVRFDVERRNYENEIAQLNQTISSKKIEIAKLYDLIETRRIESENFAQELNDAREEIARNVKYYKELESEFLILNSKYDQVTKEIGDLSRSKELYRSQIEQSQRDLAKKNRELIQKIHEVDSLKAKYEEAFAAIEPVGTLGTTSSKMFTRMSLVGDQK